MSMMNNGLTVEDSQQIKKMQDKRLRKFEQMQMAVDKLSAVQVYGNKKLS